MNKLNKLYEKLVIDVEVGDEILTGKFKNKRVTIKSIEKNDRGEPTINGRNILNFRYSKKGEIK